MVRPEALETILNDYLADCSTVCGTRTVLYSACDHTVTLLCC